MKIRAAFIIVHFLCLKCFIFDYQQNWKTLETTTTKDKEIPANKFIALDDEVRASINLIHTGLAELQNINGGNDFYYLPFILLSNGFEKLLKLIICFYTWEQHKQFPAKRDFENKDDNGHDLVYLKNKVISNCFVAITPALKKDLDILANDKVLDQLITFLGEFAQYSRYYNLNIIISHQKKKSKDIKQLWVRLENDLLRADTKLYSKFNASLKDIDKEKIQEIKKINERVGMKIIILLEIFARALTRQFTSGKLGEAKRFTGTIRTFLFLRDEDLGQRDYRKLKK